MKDSIYKFIIFAQKHPEKELHLRFRATEALGANMDFDWFYEDQKTKLVQELCTINERPKIIKKIWRHYKKEYCYYPEFYALAKRLLKQGKKRGYKMSWVYLLD